MKLEKGQRALITGASKGIGVHIARALAQKGLRLVLVARSEDKLKEIQAELGGDGCDCTVEAMDIGDHDASAKLLARLEDEGGLDLLINNAGILLDTPYAKTPAEEIHKVIEINLKAPMLLTQQALPGMLHRGRGHIVNISSLAGLGGYAHGESYCATKHGLVGFTRALRFSLSSSGRGVSASVVCPGYISDTGMYATRQEAHDLSAPAMLGTSPPSHVVKAVFRAIEKDLPEVIVNSRPIRPALAIAALFPRFAEKLAQTIGVNKVAEAIAAD